MVNNPSETMLITAVGIEPQLIEFFPEASEKVIIEAMLRDKTGAVVQVIPDHRITIAIAITAISIDPTNILHIPDHIISDDLIISALRKLKSSSLSVLRELDEKYHSERVCLSAVKNNGLALYFCKCRTRKVIEMAISKAPAAVIFLEDGEYTIEDIVSVYNKAKVTPELKTIIPTLITRMNKLGKSVLSSDLVSGTELIHYIKDVDDCLLDQVKLVDNPDTWSQLSQNFTQLFNK